MNFVNILHKIADTDPEFYERISPRRRLISNWLPKVTLATLPLALGGLFQKAYGKQTGLIEDTLNFALKLEMLESRLYETALTKTGLIPGADVSAIQLLSANETAHRTFVRNTIVGIGGTPISEPTFDFTGGNGLGTGPFADVFINYSTFLALSQTFEETGIRAYGGAMPNLMTDNAVVEAAMQIHSVEGRHAAMLRRMRQLNDFTNAKPWVTQAQSGIASNPTGAPWAGEENTTQLGVSITALGTSSDAATEAFDEPLSQAAVEAIIDPFVA